MRRLAVLMVAALMSACGSSSPAPENVAAKDPTVPLGRVTATLDRTGAAAAYEWNALPYPNAAALLTAIDQRLATDLPKVARQAQVGASVRVVLPAKYLGVPGLAEATRRLDQARVDALRAAGLFQSVRVDYLNVTSAVTKGRDYVLFKEGDDWRLRDGQDRETLLLAAETSLTGFVRAVARGVEDLNRDLDFLQVLVSRDDRPGIFFRGKEYSDLTRLNDAFDAYNMDLLRQLKGAEAPLSGRALVIIPTAQRDLPVRSRNPLMAPALRAYTLSLDKRIARFFMGSKLFSAVDVDFANENDPPQRGYDWVIWRNPAVSSWSVRERDNDTLSVRLNARPETFVADFVAAVRGPATFEMDPQPVPPSDSVVVPAPSPEPLVITPPQAAPPAEPSR